MIVIYLYRKVINKSLMKGAVLMTNNRHRRQFLLGFLGFLGFLGIRYFTTHELSDLFWFSWLVFRVLPSGQGD